MKKLNSCVVENCIPTPSSCVEWNGGDIEYLGICNGESLNNIVWEIVTKLKELAGENISEFDLDTLIAICNAKAPLEVNLVSILSIMRDNQICLKDYIDTLNDKLNELNQNQGVDVNLRCYADFDNLGNSLSINRAQLDQLVIDQLCNHKGRIETVEGKIVLLQNQLDNFDSTVTVDELSISTCVDPVVKPTSSQIKSVADEVCEIEGAIGTPAEVAIALSYTPTNLNTEFGLITNWNLTPSNWAENYGNMLLMVKNLIDRVNFMEDNCCATSCDDIMVGFSAVMNEGMTGIILRFTNGAGTSIPVGWTDAGSKVIITDASGNVSSPINIVIANNAEIDIATGGMDLAGDVTIDITVKMSNGSTVCEKCLVRTIKLPGCDFCTITALEEVTIIYETCPSGSLT